MGSDLGTAVCMSCHLQQVDGLHEAPVAHIHRGLALVLHAGRQVKPGTAQRGDDLESCACCSCKGQPYTQTHAYACDEQGKRGVQSGVAPPTEAVTPQLGAWCYIITSACVAKVCEHPSPEPSPFFPTCPLSLAESSQTRLTDASSAHALQAAIARHHLLPKC